MLLQRNLIYTAITRGKKLVVVVGTRKALAIAIGNDKPRKRYTRLAQRLA
jgi:exodeoxyribonuclease V alpha subunit